MDVNPIIYGATGMIGQGVLIECLEHPDVKNILVIGRKSIGFDHVKVREIIIDDFLDYSSVQNELTGYNACFFCLGVSSTGMSKENYTRITYDYTVKAAEVLSAKNSDMTFCFISGAGTDDMGKSKMMWARVKGNAENMLKEMPFKAAYLMRPAFIRPMKGVKSSYMIYKILGPVMPFLRKWLPKYVTTSEEVGLAMINVVSCGFDKQTLENLDIIKIAGKNHFA